MTIEENPFWIWTPEDIGADMAVRLFVDIFTDFPAVESPSHTFIHGPRGSGKSMMFRMMRPDCARQRQQCGLQALRYLGIYIPIKRTEISQTELAYLDKHPARYVFNEHLLCLYFAGKIFEELTSSRLDYSGAELNIDTLSEWAKKKFFLKLNPTYSGNISIEKNNVEIDRVIKGAFTQMSSFVQQHWDIAENLIRAQPLNSDSLAQYRGPLLSYHGFLLPLLAGLKELSFLPAKPIYLLVDDADNLSRTQTEILNSWIATRTTSTACIKASTQLRYKTRLTLGGQRIEAPHDYHDVDVSVLYTTKKEHYLNRLSLIVEKRLEVVKLPPDPRAFFPEDSEQKEEIQRISKGLRDRAEAGEGRGHRPRDDANRYARPEFIRQLGGQRKSTHTYSYSGLDQLAHISSGVVRWFLEPAARMFAEQKSRSIGGTPIISIEPSIQNDKIREFSEEFFCTEFEQMKKDAKELETEHSKKLEREADYEHLEFLIDAMGRTFFNLLKDEKRSERRVFSIALSDRLDDEVQRILNLGVQEGYLYRTTIGTKSGHGRTARYVLSRRLAPYFSLDPTSFSGYLFVTNENLRQAMLKPKALLRDQEIPDDDVQMELPID